MVDILANQEPVFQIPRFLIVFFNSDIFSRVLTFCVQVLLLISINIMVPYKSDFTKNNYDLFIKGPAVILSRDYTIHLSRVCTIHGRDVLKFSDICKIFPEFLWVIKYSCIELSSSLIFISLVFFFNFDFPNKWRIRSNAYATKILFSERPIQIFQKFNKCKS